MTVSVPAGWFAGQLGDFIELKRGYDLPSRERRDGPFPIVSSSGPSGTHAEAKVRGPGVITGRYGTIGQVFFVESDYWPLNTALYVRDFKGSDPRFVSYFLQSIDFHKYVDKAAVPGVNRNHVHLEEVAFPPIPEQRRIAAILSALDDKIELNRKMNRTLEEMAQALFKSWFIDFDGHDDLVDSEIGPVPRGWGVARAAEVAEVSIGKTPPRNEPQWFSTDPGDVRWMSIKDLGACGAYITQTTERLTLEAVERHRVKRIPDNTVVLSFKLTVGRVAITEGEMCSNEAIAHFRLPDGTPLSPEYLYSYLRAFRYDDLGSTSSIATAVNSKVIQAMPVLVPKRTAVARFDAAVQPIFRRLKCLAHESRTLATLRDTLLPKLISGELRVPEAEAMVEALP